MAFSSQNVSADISIEVTPLEPNSLKDMCSKVKLLSRELQSYTPSTLVPFRTASALTARYKEILLMLAKTKTQNKDTCVVPLHKLKIRWGKKGN